MRVLRETAMICWIIELAFSPYWLNTLKKKKVGKAEYDPEPVMYLEIKKKISHQIPLIS